MALLGTYVNSGASCMALGQNCFAHSLPTTPDWASFIPITAQGGASALSIPIHLVTRASNAVIFENRNGAGVNAEMVAQFVHAISR